MKKVLIISYSHLHKDPRVIRQILALEDQYEIETIGYSPYNDKIVHNTIQALLPSFFLKLIRKGLSFLHAHKLLTSFLINQHLPALGNLGKSYNLIICNDLYPMPLAHKLSEKYGCKLLLDLHEYYPSQITNTFLKNWEYKSYIIWLCKKYIPLANYTTSVCNCVSEKYTENFGFEIGDIITNATAYNADNKPTDVGRNIRMVHHGVATPMRDMLTMMNVMQHLPAHYELHFYLVASFPDQKQYLEQLKRQAIQDNLNVTFHDPVATQELASELNQYDIGLFILPPLTDNYYCALPNKLFEYIQARLAIAVSPNPEMAKVVKENNLGVVSADYTAKTMAEELVKMNVDQIRVFKQNAHTSAQKLSAEKNYSKIKEILIKLLAD